MSNFLNFLSEFLCNINIKPNIMYNNNLENIINNVKETLLDNNAISKEMSKSEKLKKLDIIITNTLSKKPNYGKVFNISLDFLTSVSSIFKWLFHCFFPSSTKITSFTSDQFNDCNKNLTNNTNIFFTIDYNSLLEFFLKNEVIFENFLENLLKDGYIKNKLEFLVYIEEIEIDLSKDILKKIYEYFRLTESDIVELSKLKIKKNEYKIYEKIMPYLLNLITESQNLLKSKENVLDNYDVELLNLITESQNLLKSKENILDNVDVDFLNNIHEQFLNIVSLKKEQKTNLFRDTFQYFEKCESAKNYQKMNFMLDNLFKIFNKYAQHFSQNDCKNYIALKNMAYKFNGLTGIEDLLLKEEVKSFKRLVVKLQNIVLSHKNLK
jgi:hypothetical protein